jgi:hypothetical protein
VETRRNKGGLLAVLILAATLALPVATSAAESEDNCASAPNPIVCENALPGDPASNWEVNGVGDPTIQGYATSMSVNVGQTESFKIKTEASAYHIDILRLGYYGGDGARLVASNIKPTAQLPQAQPECLHEPSTGLIDCGNWGVSAQWTVPSNAVSGVYMALLTRDDTGGQSQIVFVVRNDASHSKILLQTSDATWEAYNDYGGNSLYTCTVECPPGNPKAYKGAYSVSYNRPFDGSLSTDEGASYLWYAEYQMMRFLEKNGYDVSYTTEDEVDRNGALLKNHKIFMSSGHDEYWSAGQRANVEAAREAGVNLAFFSANELFWKTRWGPSSEGSETPYRTLTTYKETHFEGPVDPKDPPTWTGAWRDPRDPASDGGKPENELSGQQFEVNAGTSEITVPAQYRKLRLWRNTAVASLQPGQTLTLAPEVGTLGYEWDEDVDNGFRPAGEFDLSSTTVSGVQAFSDYGTFLNDDATATHHLTLYRAPSGALVFGAGTVQWSWGLDNTNAWDIGSTDPDRPPVDPNMQQFTLNLLSEMGAQPESLAPGLALPTPSTDTTPPTSTITAPKQGETLRDGSQVTISGTASDAGGGVVAGVEVSTDNGATWHPATLTTPAEQTVNWTYTWAAHGYPSTTIKSRAVDDSANLETPAAGVKVNISCPCSIWGNAITPPTPDSGDPGSVELGVKFSSEVAGAVTGIRFYKSAANAGTHFGSLWSATGERLAKAEFTNETASGWQQVNFSNPVQIAPNTTYIASYFAPTGHYADSPYYFYTPPPTGGNILNSPPLHALSASAPVTNGLYTSANGVYSYGSTSTFPTNSFQGTNYWVDPVFEPGAPSAPGQVTSVSATAGNGAATVSWSAPSSGGAPNSYTITPYIGATAQATTTITGNPPATSITINGLTNGTAYTFTVTAANTVGSGPPSSPSGAVTPTSAPTVPAAPTGVTAVAGNGNAIVSWTAPANGGDPIASYTVTPFIGTSAQTATTITGTPPATTTTITGLTNGTGYTFTVTASNAVGAGPASEHSGTATPTAILAPDTIFGQATPVTIDSGDGNSVNVGVKFSSSLAGAVTGIRFYKASTNTGTHVGSLWSASGTLLGRTTFSNETASGWQLANFSAPITIAANTTYVASYLAPKGHYSDSSSGLTSGVSNPPLSALANTLSANGLYTYSSTSVFPTSTYKATNYWVDVDFEPAATTVPGQPTNVLANPGNGSATLSWSAPAGGGAATTYTITPYIGTEAQPATTVTGSPPATGATVTGLNNGTTYTFTVTATNALGNGPSSEHSAAATPATTPSAPTAVTATAGNTSATVDWSAPASGGSPITAYTITPYVGTEAQTPTTITGTPPTTSTTITGLSNGTTYTFTVTATNALGNGPSSEHSAAATPAAPSLPSAPSEVTATAGNGSASLSWHAPSGAGAATSYTITPYIGAEAQPTTTIDGTPPASTATITGLTNGTTYTFTVTTTNAVGTSPASEASNAVTPATTPSAPSAVTATAGNASATVSWSAPASGGAAITGYTITPYIGASAQPATTVTGFPPLTATTITGLTNGTTYTFTVTATNALGNSPSSEHSATATPATTPSAPSAVTATAGNASATVTWTAPSSNGGSPLTGYTVTPYIGTEAQAPTKITGTPPTTSTTVTGLSNGTTYSFTVTAANALGNGPSSERSATITPTATPIAIDANVTVNGHSTTSTASFSTAEANEELLAFVASDGPSGTAKQSSTVSGAGLTWTLVKRANTRSGDAEIWAAPAPKALTNVTVTSTPATQGYDQSLTVVSIEHSAGVGASVSGGAANGAPSVSLTTTAPGSLLYGVGNDWDTATARTLGPSQVLLRQFLDTKTGDTFWSQYSGQAAGASGSVVTLNDTAPTADQWNLAAVEIKG